MTKVKLVRVVHKEHLRKIKEQEAQIVELEAENAFMKTYLQSHSIQMDGKHSWRWRGGWPMTSARGDSPDKAVKDAMRLVAESLAEEKKRKEDSK